MNAFEKTMARLAVDHNWCEDHGWHDSGACPTDAPAVEAHCNHDNQPAGRSYCECGARFYDRSLQIEARVAGTPFIVYRAETRQSRPVFVSMHATRLGAVRAYKRMEREFGRLGYWPVEYGWEDTNSVFGINL